MRWLALVFLIACGTTNDSMQADGCPPDMTNGAFGDDVEGTPCASTKTCFVENGFSSCASGFYSCVAGKWHMSRSIDAHDGASCTAQPMASCSYEGNPG